MSIYYEAITPVCEVVAIHSTIQVGPKRKKKALYWVESLNKDFYPVLAYKGYTWVVASDGCSVWFVEQSQVNNTTGLVCCEQKHIATHTKTLVKLAKNFNI
ncbi:hypothetical protein Brsp06_03492 [Brucella sp. NBRC 13694]|uniref:hypothetical protein n=1 Tax=Brucella sp. NBRC 13694 TaxID=3075482 RepID=UPI00241ED8BC|nr:hypothetical protein [Brucella anthropi]